MVKFENVLDSQKTLHLDRRYWFYVGYVRDYMQNKNTNSPLFLVGNWQPQTQCVFGMTWNTDNTLNGYFILQADPSKDFKEFCIRYFYTKKQLYHEQCYNDDAKWFDRHHVRNPSHRELTESFNEDQTLKIQMNQLIEQTTTSPTMRFYMDQLKINAKTKQISFAGYQTTDGAAALESQRWQMDTVFLGNEVSQSGSDKIYGIGYGIDTQYFDNNSGSNNTFISEFIYGTNNLCYPRFSFGKRQCDRYANNCTETDDISTSTQKLTNTTVSDNDKLYFAVIKEDNVNKAFIGNYEINDDFNGKNYVALYGKYYENGTIIRGIWVIKSQGAYAYKSGLFNIHRQWVQNKKSFYYQSHSILLNLLYEGNWLLKSEFRTSYTHSLVEPHDYNQLQESHDKYFDITKDILDDLYISLEEKDSQLGLESLESIDSAIKTQELESLQYEQAININLFNSRESNLTEIDTKIDFLDTDGDDKLMLHKFKIFFKSKQVIYNYYKLNADNTAITTEKKQVFVNKTGFGLSTIIGDSTENKRLGKMFYISENKLCLRLFAINCTSIGDLKVSTSDNLTVESKPADCTEKSLKNGNCFVNLTSLDMITPRLGLKQSKKKVLFKRIGSELVVGGMENDTNHEKYDFPHLSPQFDRNWYFFYGKYVAQSNYIYGIFISDKESGYFVIRALKSQPKTSSTVLALKLWFDELKIVKSYLINDRSSSILLNDNDEKFNHNANYEDIIQTDELINMKENNFDYIGTDDPNYTQPELISKGGSLNDIVDEATQLTDTNINHITFSLIEYKSFKIKLFICHKSDSPCDNDQIKYIQIDKRSQFTNKETQETSTKWRIGKLHSDFQNNVMFFDVAWFNCDLFGGSDQDDASRTADPKPTASSADWACNTTPKTLYQEKFFFKHKYQSVIDIQLIGEFSQSLKMLYVTGPHFIFGVIQTGDISSTENHTWFFAKKVKAYKFEKTIYLRGLFVNLNKNAYGY